MKYRSALICFLIAILTVIVFGDVRHGDFLGWDDTSNITLNPYLTPLTWTNLRHFWQHSYFDLYIPVTYTVWSCVASIAHLPPPGQNPVLAAGMFHGVNLVLHLANVLLVFGLLRLVLGRFASSESDPSRRDWASGAGALLFAIHPLQVESVAWISEFRGLLCAFWCLLSLGQYLRFVLDEKRLWGRYALATFFFVLALLSKPTAVALPLMAWALEVWVLQTPTDKKRNWLVPLGIWVGLSLVLVVLTRSVQTVPAEIILPIWQRPLIAGDALAFYLLKLFLPASLAPDYGRTPHFVLSHSWGYATWLVPVALTVLLWWKRAQWRVAIGALLFSFAALLPVLGLLPFIFQLISTVSDRYFYLPMFGVALLVAGIVMKIPQKIGMTVAALVFALLAFWSNVQTTYWTNTLTLAQYTLTVNPQSSKFYSLLGEALAMQGQMEYAIAADRRAVQVNPSRAEAHNNLGVLLARTGHDDEALAEYQEAIRLKSDYANAYNNQGIVMARHGKINDAHNSYEQAIKLNPEYAEAHYNMGILLAGQGKTDEAISKFREAIRLNPYYEEAHYNLATLLSGQGKFDKAIAEYVATLQINSGDADAQNALNALRDSLRR